MEMVHAIDRAIILYQDKKSLNQIRKKMMDLDFSWNKSAEEYYELYKSLK